MMRIAIIGTGNVAWQFANAFREKHNVEFIYGRNAKKAEQLAQSVEAAFSTSFNQIPRDLDLYLIAISDDQIESVAGQIPEVSGIVAHTSGSVDLTVIPHEKSGVFYPLQTLSKEKVVDWKKVPLCVESQHAESLKALTELGSDLSKNVQQIDSQQRRAIHLAAVFACNFSNHMMANAQELLRESELDFSILKPLIEETVEKALEVGPDNAQTGPAVRGDEKTLEKHRNLLENHARLLEIYNLVSQSIQDTRHE
jgi:predicted short-subunit dehydrogenase-like oxidoreductase (DUF2520 family)